MASPQKENGFTPIANDLFEAFYRCKLLEYERCVVMCIWRKTYGWNKKEDWVSNSQIFDETGIALPNITRTIKSLIAKKLLVKRGRKVAVNKDYEQWEVEWRRLSHQTTKVISPDNKKLSHQIPTKERKKLTKEITETSSEPLKDKDKDMGWNNYADDYEEGVVDLESGELHDPVAEKKKADSEMNTKFRASVDWLIKHQGRDPKRTGIPKQLKAIQKLYTMGVSASEAKQIIIESEGSDVWRGKQEKPDFWTVVSIIQKRG
jgi:phage replication O-like protein O